MLLSTGAINLEYNPTTDILTTSMPDIKQFTLSEVRFCLELIVDNIKNYDIKNLLLDASKSVIEVEDSAYKAVTTQFALALRSTRLKRIARVGTPDLKREEKSTKVATELRQELNLPIEYKTFHSKAEALEWLLTTKG